MAAADVTMRSAPSRSCSGPSSPGRNASGIRALRASVLLRLTHFPAIRLAVPPYAS